MDRTDPKGTETKDEYLRRLKRTAAALPKKYVRAVLARMKANIQSTIDVRGHHAKND